MASLLSLRPRTSSDFRPLLLAVSKLRKGQIRDASACLGLHAHLEPELKLKLHGQLPLENSTGPRELPPPIGQAQTPAFVEVISEEMSGALKNISVE